MNTGQKRSRKFRIAKNGEITQTLQLTLVSPQNPLPHSVRVSIYTYTLFSANKTSAATWISPAVLIWVFFTNKRPIFFYGTWYKEISKPYRLKNKTLTNWWVLKFYSSKNLETGLIKQSEHT